MKINFQKIEQKWQKKWEEKKLFEVKEDKKKKKFYILDMFPYPSGEGLHIGHAFVFSLGDIFARFKRLQGYNVLYPIGYDALGLPAENAAIKVGTHPKDYTQKSIQNFMRQQKAMGWSYDWSRMFKTSEPSYYKWDQWIFLKMLEKGFAYKKKAPVNWCPKCKTVLANEQVHNGKCEYHPDTDVEMKHLEQWFFKITDYADELLEGLEKLNWPETAKKLQRNWIGKSHGTEIDFEIRSPKTSEDLEKSSDGKKWPIFTTRPDTIFGVTFMVVSVQHPKLAELVAEKQKKSVNEFLKKIKSVSQKSMKEVEELDKEGVFTGSYAINPITKEKIPVYAGNFVIADYGSGMVMGVPAHDQRDFEFAKKYKIPIKVVIDPIGIEIEKPEKMASAYTEKGNLINSGQFNGMGNESAKEKITDFLIKNKTGRKLIQFKLRDWLISRQRYWGTPIPVVYCNKCGIIPVPERDLPVVLPEKIKFGKGNPLETNKEWINTTCPKCRGKARRETDTMDTFVNSSWYYLRYCDSKNNKKIFDSKKMAYWCPIDQYIGGPEHITMHLIYIRFYTKFLRDLGLLKFDEPALRYFTQGIVHGNDGEKMSKSKGNVVEPLGVINKFGADTLRIALMSFASPDKDSIWDEKIVFGSYKFLNKFYDYFTEFKAGKTDGRTANKINKTIKEVSLDIENFKHNLVLIKLRELFNLFLQKEVSKEDAEKLLKMLHPFCPHITEELWEKLGNRGFISLEKWPVADERKINEIFDKQEEAIEKLIQDILNIIKLVEARGQKKEKVYVYVLSNEKEFYDIAEIKKRIGKSLEIFSVNDKHKYDPNGISKKSKPGKPGIYLE